MKKFFARARQSRYFNRAALFAAAFIFIILVSLPLLAVAADAGLVPCGVKYGSAGQKHLCTACDIFTLLQTVLNATYDYIAAPVAALMLGWGGLYMIFGGFGNPRMYESGKKILGNAAIGLAIIFISWLAVDTLLKAFQALQYGGSSAFGPWNKITCTEPEIQGAQHMGCDQGSCVKVPGFGANTCSEDKNCGENPVHNVCDTQGQSCQQDLPCAQGNGLACVNSCKSDEDCLQKGAMCKGAECPDSGVDFCSPGGQATGCSDTTVYQWLPQLRKVAIGKTLCGNVSSERLLEGIMSQESGGVITRVSPSGACGLMQLLPATANQFKSGCTTDQVTCSWLTTTANAQASICIALNYASSLVGPCGCSVLNIAAGYNGGGAATGACGVSQNCGPGTGECKACPDQTGPTLRWQCLWDDNAHTTCNAKRAEGSFEETRRYAPKVLFCSRKLGI